jgi:thymidylate synthase (FAD)
MPPATINVLDHGFVTLRNVSGPTRRLDQAFDADDTDPANCARMSFDQMDSGRTREDEFKLVDYLMRNGHSTPIEMIQVWVEMKLPIFVARQFVRHRTQSLNEVSARYTKLSDDWYIPAFEVIGGKAKSNKQGRAEAPHPEAKWFRDELDFQCGRSYGLYTAAINKGIAPELARLFLHVNHYTHWITSVNLHNLMHFLALRQGTHAQYEARVYAEAVLELLEPVLPELMRLYRKYRQQA